MQVHIQGCFFNKLLYCFQSTAGNLWLQKTKNWSTSFYIGDLSVHGFWFPQGVLEPIPCRFQGTTQCLRSQKLYADVWQCRGSATLKPLHCLRVNCMTAKQTAPNLAPYNYHKLSSDTSSLLHRPVQRAACIFSWHGSWFSQSTRSKTSKVEAANVFYDLALEVTLSFLQCPIGDRGQPYSMEKGLHRGMRARRQNSLGPSWRLTTTEICLWKIELLLVKSAFVLFCLNTFLNTHSLGSRKQKLYWLEA